MLGIPLRGLQTLLGAEASVSSEWCWAGLGFEAPGSIRSGHFQSTVVSQLLGRALKALIFQELFLLSLISTFSLPRSHPAPPCLGMGDFTGYKVGLVTHVVMNLGLWTVRDNTSL